MHHTVANLSERITKTLKDRVLPAIHVDARPASVSARTVSGEPIPFDEAIDATFAPLAPGTWWGRPWGTTWFKIDAIAPEYLSGTRRELLTNLGFNDGGPGFQSEGLAWDTSGTPIKGIEPKTTYLAFPDDVKPGEIWTVYVEAASNARVQNRHQALYGDLNTAPDELLYQFTGAHSVLLDEETWHLALDMQMLFELHKELDQGSPRRHQILRALSDAVDEMGTGPIAPRAAAARTILRPLLEAPAPESTHRITGVGHAHIDSAWLWPIRETKRKCARTFSNVLDLARQYHDFVFACSSAQQYVWVKEEYPRIYADLREAVARGQFVPVGGMWVESDTNMPGSEGLVRQFTQGQRFFESEFGITCHEVWLPDSFGFTAALPQIARLAEHKWMFSQKMSWNQTNQFPHSTFWWEGIDGSRIFTHFPPSDTYSASLSGCELSKSYRNYQETGLANSSLMPFGYGDGGGGPVREMVELAHRTANLEGSPRFTISTPAKFFAAAESEYAQAPVWTGEMYLEFHRGTYTSQIAMKQGNRQMEHLMTEAEHWSAQATLEQGADYPYDELDVLWREVCLLQFHDILPGSSIAWVHQEARERFDELAQQAEAVTAAALARLAGNGDVDLVVNPAPVASGDIPAFGSAPRKAAAEPVRATESEDGFELDNAVLRVTINRMGLITSAVDLATGRECLSGPANLLQLHPDLPNQFEAWDIDEFYRNHVEDLTDVESIHLDTNDPASPTVMVRRRFHDSQVQQSMTLRAGSRLVECHTELDWHQHEQLLKVAFPTSVHTRHVTCEIQFGHIERPVHRNTSWDAAQFEICAHRFVHVAEPGFGVSVINKGIYGHDVTRPETGTSRGALPTTVRLSLARGPVYPDPFTDQGHHSFTYALAVGTELEDAVTQGWRMAMPPRTLRGNNIINPIVSASDGVTVTAVKLADDRSGDLVIRCHEALGRRTNAQLEISLKPAVVRPVNLLEREDGESETLVSLDTNGHTISFSLNPFQIATLRVTPSRSRE